MKYGTLLMVTLVRPNLHYTTGADPDFLEPGFLRSEDCLYAPSYIPYAFVVKVENKIHIVNIAY